MTASFRAEPPFWPSPTSVRRRVDRVAARLRAEALDAMVVASIRDHAVRHLGLCDPDFPGRSYGTPAVALVAVLPDGRTRGVINGFPFLTDRLVAMAAVDDLVVVPGPPEDALDELASWLAGQCPGATRVAVGGGEIDWLLATALSDRLPGRHVVDATRWMRELRRRKDEEEIELMARAYAIARAAVADVGQRVVEGASDHDLYAWVVGHMVAAGGDENSFALLGLASDAHVELAAPLHGRRLGPADVVVLEALPYVKGYNAEYMAALPVGPVAAEQAYADEACRRALSAATDALAVGAEVASVAGRADEILRDAGFVGSTHEVAHFVGVDNYEGGAVQAGDRFEDGTVLTVHPNLVVPGRVRAIAHETFVASSGEVVPLGDVARRAEVAGGVPS